jgi:hypothetical protein
MVEAWNGATWAVQPTGNVSDAAFAGVTCMGSADCTAVGATLTASTIAEASDGTGWSVQPTPNRVATSRQLQAVTCVSPVSCVAVGNTVGSAGYEVTLAESYSG